MAQGGKRARAAGPASPTTTTTLPPNTMLAGGDSVSDVPSQMPVGAAARAAVPTEFPPLGMTSPSMGAAPPPRGAAAPPAPAATAAPAGAVDTDGPVVPVVDAPAPLVIPPELQKPVDPSSEYHAPTDLENAPAPSVVPVQGVDDQFDLTPRTFQDPPPDPDAYFARYNKWAPLARTTGDRRLLKQIYDQAKSSYTEAQTAWNERKALFETQEGKRLAAANAAAQRQLEINKDAANQQFSISGKVYDASKAADREKIQQHFEDARNMTGQQGALNKEQVARLQDEYDKKVAYAQSTAGHLADEQFGINQKNIEAAKIKPVAPEEQEKIITSLMDTSPANAAAGSPTEGPLATWFRSSIDPNTGVPYPTLEAATKGLGDEFVDGVQQLAAHLVHASSMAPRTATLLMSHLLTADPDDPKNGFKVLKPDVAGNYMISVRGSPPFKISKEMAGTINELRGDYRDHTGKVIEGTAARKEGAGLRDDAQYGTAGRQVSTNLRIRPQRLASIFSAEQTGPEPLRPEQGPERSSKPPPGCSDDPVACSASYSLITGSFHGRRPERSRARSAAAGYDIRSCARRVVDRSAVV